MSEPANFDLHSYRCSYCHIESHYPPPLDPLDGDKHVPKYCPYCDGRLRRISGGRWRLVEDV